MTSWSPQTIPVWVTAVKNPADLDAVFTAEMDSLWVLQAHFALGSRDAQSPKTNRGARRSWPRRSIRKRLRSCTTGSAMRAKLPPCIPRQAHLDLEESADGQRRLDAVRLDVLAEVCARGQLLVAAAKHEAPAQRSFGTPPGEMRVQDLAVHGLCARGAAGPPVQLGIPVHGAHVQAISAGTPRAKTALCHPREVPVGGVPQEVLAGAANSGGPRLPA
eukprot:3037234-Pyramimonas_sp.AAC.1